jgi:hypothetical protein
VNDLFRALWRNDDDSAYRTGRAVLAGEHAWLEQGVVPLDLTVEALRPRLPPTGAPEKERPTAASRPVPVA